MGNIFHDYLYGLLLLINAQVQQSGQKTTDWAVIIPIISAVISAILTGFVFKRAEENRKSRRELENRVKEAEYRELESKKNQELAEIRGNYERRLQEKDFEINQRSLNLQEVKSQLEDKIRSLEGEKKFELDLKELEIRKLDSENANLRLKSPEVLYDTYSELKKATDTFVEDLRTEISKLETQVDNQNKEIEELRIENADKEIINIELIRKEELEAREKIFKKYLLNFSNLQERTKRARVAENWIEINKKSLVKGAVEHISEKYPQETKVSILEHDMDDYLDWVWWSLRKGYPISLKEIQLKPRVSGLFLSEAFRFIKKERISRELTDKSADEINLFINELIAYFSSPAFR